MKGERSRRRTWYGPAIGVLALVLQASVLPGASGTDPPAWSVGPPPAVALLSGPARTALVWERGLLVAPPASGGLASSRDLPATPLMTAPAEEYGTDVRVNDPEQDHLPNCNMQAGVSLARWGDRIVAGWNDGRQCEALLQRTGDRLTGGTTTGISLSGFGWSDDAGMTWHDGGELPVPDGGNVFGDPVVAAGPDGTFYYATLLGTPGCCRIGVYRSEDGGVSWQGPVLLAPERPDDLFHDKPWIAVDTSEDSPHRGTVHVAWTNVVEDESGFFHPDEVLLVRSTDGGRSFTEATPISHVVMPDGSVRDRPGSAAQVAVGPEGEVYLAWVDLVANSQGFLYSTRSTDGGRTFPGGRMVARMTMPGYQQACSPLVGVAHVVNGDIRVAHNPSFAVDTSDSPYRGRLYIAVGLKFHDPAVNRTDLADIVLFTSDDGGITWTNVEVDQFGQPRDPQEKLNDDGTWTDQFHATVAVAGDGTVAVSWYDRRLSPRAGQGTDPYGNWLIDVFATTSTDGGETFSPNVRVTDVSFPPARTNPHANWLAGCFMGDYNAMVGAGPGEFLLAWGDNREGTPALPDPNVYVAPLSASR